VERGKSYLKGGAHLEKSGAGHHWTGCSSFFWLLISFQVVQKKPTMAMGQAIFNL
jgi:hypothetical protein